MKLKKLLATAGASVVLATSGCSGTPEVYNAVEAALSAMCAEEGCTPQEEKKYVGKPAKFQARYYNSMNDATIKKVVEHQRNRLRSNRLQEKYNNIK